MWVKIGRRPRREKNGTGSAFPGGNLPIISRFYETLALRQAERVRLNAGMSRLHTIFAEMCAFLSSSASRAWEE
jgi:hypothetical protein